jgi:hypothetical protein
VSDIACRPGRIVRRRLSSSGSVAICQDNAGTISRAIGAASADPKAPV